MKIGIFPGTFDPIHEGHLKFAASARKAAGLERIIIVAEKEPYRKKPHASWDHRQAMIERAAQALEGVDHDYRFAADLAHQHTVANLLEAARKHYGEAQEFWFLAGSDILEHMHRWEEVSSSQEYGGFVIALRHDHTKEWVEEKLVKAKESGYELNVVVVESPARDLGSTTIRQQISENQDTPELPSQVSEYIKQHNLYAATGFSSE